ncbi:AimR family lysis-lysogeny pheromone receptor [Thalassobacillus pellis]|uniref:AimR family lysis-lysogeny pheromone receptor n=1 Tax=Thalassobacillus pellis TaxID=748008 RepID=UPI00195F9E38|nr:AimR family lysis-lysogeny pheromone receptor [Thalassobacillus pellis]MBM7553772.1 tetratricopeptide (TPR) repeat protein [Thalassobacillus pellis]
MGNHIIEPSPIHQLHMKHTSSIYDLYLTLLDDHPQEKATQIVKEYCLSNFPHTMEDQLAYLEFFYMNDYFTDLEYFLQSYQVDDQAKVLYGILYRRVHKKFTSEDLEWVETLHFEHPSLHCLHIFTKIYGYYDLMKFTGMDKFMDVIYQALLRVEEPLFHYYMKLRYNEVLFNHYWKTDYPLLAKKHAYKIINIELSPRRKCQIHHNLALCSLYDGYNAAIDHANIALNIARLHGFEGVISGITNHTIPFIAAFHQKTDGIDTPDPVEKAHLFLARGEYPEAIAILEKLESLTPFQECYLGFARRDRAMMNNSYHRFISENGDYFFARLPKTYLERF